MRQTPRDPDTAAWTEVDRYFSDRLQPEDDTLVALQTANDAAGLPAINVSPLQGRFLALLVQITGARRVLEIGTLGGYSTLHMARALPPGGRLTSLEIDPRHAARATANLEAAGVSDRVEVLTGLAADLLPGLSGPFDLVFIDADKPSNPVYLRHALALSRPGTVVVVDNVVRRGVVIDTASEDPNVRGVRALLDMIAAEPRLTATALQTVGEKGWDGFVLLRIDG